MQCRTGTATSLNRCITHAPVPAGLPALSTGRRGIAVERRGEALTLSVVVPLKDEEGSIPILVERILKVAREAGLNLARDRRRRRRQQRRHLDGDRSASRSEHPRGVRPPPSAQFRQGDRAHGRRRRRDRRHRRHDGRRPAGRSRRAAALRRGDRRPAPISSPAGRRSGTTRSPRRCPRSSSTRSPPGRAASSLHDFNCGYKAYRREIFETVQLYGELHRYTPVLADALGYRIVGDHGASPPAPLRPHANMDAARFIRGFLDLLTVLTITRFAYRPSHLFGGIGTLLLVFGGACRHLPRRPETLHRASNRRNVHCSCSGPSSQSSACSFCCSACWRS